MTRREIWKLRLGVLALVAGLGLLTAAFAASATQSPQRQTASGAYKPKQKRFGNFRIAFNTNIDFLDPGASYTVEGWQVMWNVYMTLLTYKHAPGAAGNQLGPGLAEAFPRVSSNGKRYTFRLRKGLKYSDGTPIRASDMKFTIKRLYQIDSEGVGFFTNIVGAEQFAKTKTGDIPGVVTNNARRTIEFRLVKPRGDFVSVMALLFAAPVPPSASTSGPERGTIPASGPYRISNYVPDRGFTLLRNPNFKPTKNIPRTNPDRISVDIVGSDSAALQQVLSGDADYDYHTVPVDRLAEIQNKYPKQLKIYTPANTYYFWMNTRIAPFNKLKARQAVNYAIDRRALVRIRGGLARTTQNVLPPTYASYKKLNLYPYDLAKARRLINEAGVAGTRVVVWTRDREDVKKDNAYLADQLEKIGLKPEIKVIAAGTYYTTIGNQSTPDRHIGWARWFQDYNHPLDWFDVLLNGNRITDVNNNNYANANFRAINRTIERLKLQPRLTKKVNAQWAAVDRSVMKQAPWAPYVNVTFTDFFTSSMDMSCYYSHPVWNFDFSRICKK